MFITHLGLGAKLEVMPGTAKASPRKGIKREKVKIGEKTTYFVF